MAGTSAAWNQYMNGNAQTNGTQWGPNTYLNPFDPWVDPALVNRNPLLWPGMPMYPTTPYPPYDPAPVVAPGSVEEEFIANEAGGKDPMGGRGYEGMWDSDYWGGEFTPESVGFGGMKNLKSAMGLLGGLTKGGLLSGLFSKALDPRYDQGLMQGVEQMIGKENMPAFQQTLEQAFDGLTPGSTMKALFNGTLQSSPMYQNVLNSTQTAIGAALQKMPGLEWLGDVQVENLNDIPGGYEAARGLANELGISVEAAARALSNSGATNMGALGNLGLTMDELNRGIDQGLLGNENPADQWSGAYEASLERAAKGAIARKESKARMEAQLSGGKTGKKDAKSGNTGKDKSPSSGGPSHGKGESVKSTGGNGRFGGGNGGDRSPGGNSPKDSTQEDNDNRGVR